MTSKYNLLRTTNFVRLIFKAVQAQSKSPADEH